MLIKNNTTSLQEILNTINSLPEAGGDGVDLPELTNPATSEEIFLDKETIDANGNVQTGTFTIDSELTTQNDLIAQIQNAVDNLPDAGSGEGGGGIDADVCSIYIPEYANKLHGISYIKCENGTYAQATIIPDTSNYTITNVWCGSIVYIEYDTTYCPSA